MNSIKLKTLALITMTAFCQTASAHTGLLPTGGLADGFVHPFLGLDHLLVMLGVGLWAGSQAPHAAGRIVAIFLLYMLGGALLAMHGVQFAYIESTILLSLLAIGGLLAVGQLKLSEASCAALIAVSGALHGMAHGGEIPVAASAYGYLPGMMAATGLLHGLGLSGSLLLRKGNAAVLTRIYGGVTGAIGAWLLFSA